MTHDAFDITRLAFVSRNRKMPGIDPTMTRPPCLLRRASTYFSLCTFLSLVGGSSQESGATFQLIRSTVELRYLDYAFAVEKDERGVPKMNWKAYKARPEREKRREVDAVILQTAAYRATLIPNMGRLHSFVNQQSGREQLWVNPIAVPLGANNDTGFWMTWGGIEHVMPRREHGTSHALSWNWSIVKDSDQEMGVTMQSTEPLTGLQHEITYRAKKGRPSLETHIRVTNNDTMPKRFSHWTTATLAPGGEGEVTPNTEIIVPAERFVPDDREFNGWMTDLIGPTDLAPIRLVKNWKSIGDLMTTPLKQGYYAVFSHERQEGLARAFSLDKTPGFDIWGWGYPPTEARQREFTRRFPSRGYIEFWNGNVHGFKDHSLATLPAGESLEWTEYTFVFESNERGASLRRSIETLVAGTKSFRR